MTKIMRQRIQMRRESGLSVFSLIRPLFKDYLIWPGVYMNDREGENDGRVSDWLCSFKCGAPDAT